jgi:hypothetical protein
MVNGGGVRTAFWGVFPEENKSNEFIFWVKVGNAFWIGSRVYRFGSGAGELSAPHGSQNPNPFDFAQGRLCRIAPTRMGHPETYDFAPWSFRSSAICW